MTGAPEFLMIDPGHFDVSYRINPWMQPAAWAEDPAGGRLHARRSFDALRRALRDAGARVETAPGAPGWPDMVFPANAAIVLDGKALAARFRHPERRGEEAPYLRILQDLCARGLLREVEILPDGIIQEGAGDAIWDAARGHFWSGYGPRSDEAAATVISHAFRQPVVGLELASPRYYHLDTCFCPLSGGEVLYHPPAFTPQALEAIRARVAPDLRIEATAQEAAAFCVNAVNIGRALIMARPPAGLRARLEARGYRVSEVDLAPFLLSGGAAYCMTLRLDRTSHAPAALAADIQGAA